MRSWKPAAKLATLILICAVTGGAGSCESGDPGPTFVTDLVLKNAAGEVRQEFARGAPITFELPVRNRTRNEVVVQFGSGQHFDFVVFDAGTSRVRWHWSSGRAFILMPSQIEFAPGEIKIFGTEWDQRDNDGRPLPPGDYEARGVLLFAEFPSNPHAPHQLGSPLKAFRIN